MIATRSPSVTIVSSPLRTTTAPLQAAGLLGGGEAAGGDLVRVALEQPAELARVRGEDGRRRAGGEAIELAGEGVQTVGVDHQRRRDPRRDGAGERQRVLVGGRGPGRALRRRRARRPPATPPPPRCRADRPGRRSLWTSPRPRRLRRPARGRRGRRRSRSRAAPARIAAVEDIRTAPVRPREPPAIVTWPEENLVDCEPAARRQVEHRGFDHAGRGGGLRRPGRGTPIGATTSSPVAHLPGAT